MCGNQPGPETPWTYPNWLSLSSSLILGSLDMSIFTGLFVWLEKEQRGEELRDERSGNREVKEEEKINHGTAGVAVLSSATVTSGNITSVSTF